jgi:hypothetical protein
MKSIFRLSALCVALNAQSQIETIINGSIEGLADGTKIFLVPGYLNSKDLNEQKWRDSATVKNTYFSFKVNKSFEGTYDIRITRAGGMDQGKHLSFYLGGGTIKIKSSNGKFDGAQITGSAYAQDYGQFLSSLNKQPFANEIKKNRRENNSLEKKISGGLRNKQDSLYSNSLLTKYFELDSIKAQFSKKWIESNSLSTVVAVQIIFDNIYQKIDHSEVEILLDKLPEQSRNNFIALVMQKKIESVKITAV